MGDMPDTDMVFPDIALFLSGLLLYITIMAKDPPMLSPIMADTVLVTDTPDTVMVTDSVTVMVITTAKDPQKPNPITDMVVMLITLDMLRLMSDVPFGDLENKM